MLRFVQLSDTHIMPDSARRSWWMPDSPTYLLRQALRQIARIPELDFVLITGDLVDAADAASFECLGAILRQDCPVPFYLAPGNHDLVEVLDPAEQALMQQRAPRYGRPQVAAWMQNLFACAWAPTGWLDYSLSPCPGMRIICLDSSIDVHKDGPLPCSVGVVRPEQLQWLHQELQRCQEEWVVVMVHHPPFVTAISRPWSPFLFGDYRIQPPRARQLHQVLRQHPRIAVVLSGHWHLPQLYQQDGIPYLTAPGVVGPLPAYRLLQLENNGTLHYQWQWIELSQPRPTPLWAPLACGRPWDRRGTIRRAQALGRVGVKSLQQATE
ncbi:MAG: metallophosphoesterase [Thermostichales cyanobacterium BF4_bins_65]